jgi:hypothetical protein
MVILAAFLCDVTQFITAQSWSVNSLYRYLYRLSYLSDSGSCCILVRCYLIHNCFNHEASIHYTDTCIGWAIFPVSWVRAQVQVLCVCIYTCMCACMYMHVCICQVTHHFKKNFAVQRLQEPFACAFLHVLFFQICIEGHRKSMSNTSLRGKKSLQFRNLNSCCIRIWKRLWILAVQEFEFLQYKNLNSCSIRIWIIVTYTNLFANLHQD